MVNHVVSDIIKFIKKTRINNQITAPELMLIDENGKSLGILTAGEALKIAKEKELDLIEIAPTASPPVAKIMDYGKFRYQEQKKTRETTKKNQRTETKSIRVKIGTSQHDLELKAKKISAFLKEKNRVKIDLILRGRAKFLAENFLKERMERVLNLITEQYKIADGPQRTPSGISLVIEYGKNK
ncbi:MAG: translation initiation factor IF-3 [Patescibacteria group bacterium]